MDEKVVLVTGANTGIGKETAAAVAARGATTLLACRNLAKGHEAAADIRAMTGNENVVVIQLDLKDLAAIERCASEVNDRFGRVDVLVNNAGGWWSSREVTAQGFEQTFAVNYLGHYVLTRLLLESLRHAAPSRIVNVTSLGHFFVRGMNWDDLQSERRWWPSQAYGQSKLALILFTRELARRFGDSGIVAHVGHPGVARTRFGQDGDLHGASKALLRVTMLVSVPPERGARTSIHLATSPEVVTSNGRYWSHAKPARSSRAARDDDAARRLWDVSEQLVTRVGMVLPSS
ncbi:MAG: SDR family oxidoreductase [Acidimicrobiales bacterium]